MAFEIRPYSGDGTDLADLIVRTWMASFAGKAWFPLWDRAYVNWRIMDQAILDRDLIVSAYAQDRLVGCIVAEKTDFSIHGKIVSGSLTSYLSVDPDTRHKGVSFRLVDQLCDIHIRRGIKIALGVTSDLPG